MLLPKLSILSVWVRGCAGAWVRGCVGCVYVCVYVCVCARGRVDGTLQRMRHQQQLQQTVDVRVSVGPIQCLITTASAV